MASFFSHTSYASRSPGLCSKCMIRDRSNGARGLCRYCYDQEASKLPWTYHLTPLEKRMTRLLALTVVTYFPGVSWGAIKGKGKKEPLSIARSWFQYLLHADAGISVLSIARIVQRDHGNVRLSILRLQRKLDESNSQEQLTHSDLSALFASINRTQKISHDDEGWYHDNGYTLGGLGIFIAAPRSHPPNVP